MILSKLLNRAIPCYCLLTLINLIGCRNNTINNKDPYPMVNIGPDLKVEVVLIFFEGTKDEDIEYIWTNRLSEPDPSGQGHRHKQGIGSLLKIKTKDGKYGIAIKYNKNINTQNIASICGQFSVGKDHIESIKHDVAPSSL